MERYNLMDTVRQMRINKRNRDLANEIADYILEFEHDDFYYYCDMPSKNHVYYKAYLLINGDELANEMLQQAIKDRDA